MKIRYLAPLSLITLVATILWLVLLIFGLASVGPVASVEQALDFAAQGGILYTLTYLNAALVTVAVSVLFAGLYAFLRSPLPNGTRIALVFIPAYAALNLFVYLAQVSVVPRLVELQSHPELGPAASLLAAQMLQQWPGSLAAFINSLAYAVLGIPSIIFGVALVRIGGIMRLAGPLLLLNGVACILGLAGLMAGNELLQAGTAAGGGLFLLALIPLTLGLYQERWQ